MINFTAYRILKLRRSLAVLSAAAIVGVLAAFLADTLKVITELYEEHFLHLLKTSHLLVFILPFCGLSAIYLLRKFVFHNKVNKGIKEVLDTINNHSNTLPSYKIPSHYINGFLTVIFGGSTGIEVSTVVSTAAIGALSSKKSNILRKYKTDLVCAGLAAGVTALFNAPVAGFLFAFEVFTRRRSKLHSAAVIAAVITSYLLTNFVFYDQIFHFEIRKWHVRALPYMALLGILAGVNAVFLTRCVLFMKLAFQNTSKGFAKIAVGAVVVSVLLYFFPDLYGDGYSGINQAILLASEPGLNITPAIALLLLLKPLATSVTLAAGGDGGVFAPSLFIGAFLGMIVSMALNHLFGLDLIPVNFMLIGMAAVLSASIHAPLTAVFLVCAISSNYTLFLPIIAACLISYRVASKIFPYSVYTYK